MKMIDKIKEYIGEAQAFSTQNPAELEALELNFLELKGF
jgi:phenylalanyl-tRNA synthetase alpha chain